MFVSNNQCNCCFLLCLHPQNGTKKQAGHFICRSNGLFLVQTASDSTKYNVWCESALRRLLTGKVTVLSMQQIKTFSFGKFPYHFYFSFPLSVTGGINATRIREITWTLCSPALCAYPPSSSIHPRVIKLPPAFASC